MFDNLGGITVLDSLATMSNDELLMLRERINLKLDDLTNIDLEKELVNQFIETKAMLTTVRDDDEIPPTQKASLITACSSLLAQLTKNQKELYNTERVKIMEATLIEALREVDNDLVEQFLELYEIRLEAMSA